MEFKRSIGYGHSLRFRPHLSARAYLFAAAIAILALAALFAAAPARAQDQGAEPLWSADMLVVEYTSDSIGAASADLFSNVGGSADLQIKWLWSYIPNRDLRLAFEETVPDADDLALQVGSLTLEFPGGSSGQSGFTFEDVDVDWEDGQTIPVRIVSASAQSNNPATGTPTISGTAQVGKTLDAHTDGIADADGMAGATFSYQWLADDSDISGAASSSYIPVSADVGKTVKVRVSFVDDGDNEESLTSAATAVVAATKPDAPQNVRVAPHDANSLDVSWEAPSSDGGSAVTGYKVQRKEATGSWDTPADVSEETVTGNARTITGLTEGVAYAVRVIATNDVGDGPASDEATGTPRETTPPELVTAVVDGTALTLTYKESLDENTVPAAEAFAVMVGGTATTVDAVSISGSAVTLTLAQGAAAGDTVTVSYTVPSDAAASRIKDLAGNAAPSFSGQEVTNNTAGTAEDEEFTTPNAPTELSVAALNEGMRLSWTAPEDSTVTGYQILRYRPYECEPTLMVHVADTGTTATTFIDPDLDRNVRYTYRVKAINGDKVGSWSNFATSRYFAPKHVTRSNTPAAPHSLDSIGTHGGIELTWEPPNGEEGIVGYRILRQRPEECEKSFRVHVENTGSTSDTFMDEDVEVGTKYIYRVKAINENGHGVWSNYTTVRKGVTEVIIISSHDREAIAKGTTASFQVSASHLPRDNDPETVDYILRGDVTKRRAALMPTVARVTIWAPTSRSVSSIVCPFSTAERSVVRDVWKKETTQ